VTEVVNSIHIDGPVEAVFDHVTTTRHWPQWHPATESVGGVTDRPLALGDEVFESARIGGRLHEGTWTVTELVRPVRVVLQIGGGRIQITYRFAQFEQSTQLQRELRYRPEDFAGGTTDPQALAERMQAQSQTALEQLKPLVEGLLADALRS
jgi:uncharacterized protein YndB with AHSA1/START domain